MKRTRDSRDPRHQAREGKVRSECVAAWATSAWVLRGSLRVGTRAARRNA